MIQLKIKTEYSFGQTFCPIPRAIARLKEINCTAAGIVDNNTWGHVAWSKACKEAGIKPLLGVELNVVFDDIPKRMWFLARNKKGLSELYQLSSKAYTQCLKTRSGSIPILYPEDIETVSSNIIKFAGDVTDGDFLKKNDVVIDLNPSSRILNAKKRSIAENQILMTVDTSDNSYCTTDDKRIFELISKAGLKQTPQHILKSLSNTEEAKELVDGIDDFELPTATMIRAEGDLESICREGIKHRGMDWDEEYEKRLQYELALIRSKDFESYFIIVADIVHYAKKHMLVGVSRGSAAGSLVCYASRITEIDPIPPKLYFERFIDVTRTDLPDIDLDFPDNKRHMVFKYMAGKYGNGNVAHIGTISAYRPKSALIQVCKALHIPPQATGSVKSAMIIRSSADARANNCLQDTFEQTAQGREFIKMYPQAIDTILLEGHASHTGVHAAGLLVSNEDIKNYATVDHNGVAQIDKRAAESLGLLKIDILGLRTLSILEDSGVDIDWYNLPFDDEKTFEVFNSGRLCGIFQFDGEAMRRVSKRITFDCLNDIDAVTALARPGPFAGGVTHKYLARNNGEHYSPIHPLVAAHMKDTFGLPVYQEQTLAIVREIGKFDWKETSAIRKAMSKAMGEEFFDSYWGKFKEGAMSQGISEKEARETWEMIHTMGSWQMNKAHTYSYAVISYWTAYLKANHPLEFAAATLRSAKDDDSAIMLLREMHKEGIRYSPFDIEKSEVNWAAKNGVLYGGFIALKGIGEIKAKKLIESRDAGTLTDKQKDTIRKAENTFTEIFPIASRYKNIYDDPEGSGVAGKISYIEDLEDIPHGEERVFIAEMIHKNPRNANEAVNVKKRGGKLETAPLDYLDLHLRDDTGAIKGRINRFDYERMGREITEKVPVGAHLLIRSKFFNKIRYAFIKKWRRLDV